MTKDEALKLALEALELTARDYREQRHAIAAIREALAEQPAQVDPCPGCLKGRVCRTPKCGRLKLPADHPLRSEQPAQQPAQQQEPCQCPECQVTPHASDCAVHNEPAYPNGVCSCKAQPEQEPVKLWLWKNFVNGRPEYWSFDNAFPVNMNNNDPQTIGEPCGYAWLKPSRQGRFDVSDEEVLRAVQNAKEFPPHRKPLTDQEIADLWDKTVKYAPSEVRIKDFARAIEAAHSIKE